MDELHLSIVSDGIIIVKLKKLKSFGIHPRKQTCSLSYYFRTKLMMIPIFQS
jgi:hypothetical protein